MKLFKMTAVAIVLLFSPCLVHSMPIYIGKGEGNDNNEIEIERLINASSAYNGLRPADIEFYAKVDMPNFSNGLLTLTYDSSNKSGTWRTHDPVDFLTIKAATGYTIWWLDPSTDFGSWSTEFLVNRGGNQPAVSHVTAWTLKTVSIPEAATGLLLILGLGAVAALKRGRSSNLQI